MYAFDSDSTGSHQGLGIATNGHTYLSEMSENPSNENKVSYSGSKETADVDVKQIPY